MPLCYVCCLARLFLLSFGEKDDLKKKVKKGLAEKCLPTNALDEFAKRIPDSLFEKQTLQGQ